MFHLLQRGYLLHILINFTKIEHDNYKVGDEKLWEKVHVELTNQNLYFLRIIKYDTVRLTLHAFIYKVYEI